jgi:diacylglycerol kinase family enzyme
VLAYGGDGTVHEVVNGLLSGDGGGPPRLGIIPAGTGNDVARNSGIPADAEAAIARLAPERPRPVDAARIRFHSREGLSRTRFFINSTSVGVSPVANHIAARVRRVLPGKICYALGGVLALIAESAGSYTVTSGEATLFSGPALNLTLANGASFGGGMRISPASVVSDGTLDLVVIGAIGRIRALLALSRLYAGTHVRMGGIRVVPARQPVHLRRADRAMLIEADGAEFEAGNDLWVDILPGAVQLL